MSKFRDYKENMYSQITFIDGEFYPDYLETAKSTYHHVYEIFKSYCSTAKSSTELLKEISRITDSSRIQLLRMFRLFVSPDTSVEMLKSKERLPKIIEIFGSRFRPIEKVREKLSERGLEDEALYAILYEYKDRGKKGYDLTEKFFKWFEKKYQPNYQIEGPIRSGGDVILSKKLSGYKKKTPADFFITDKTGEPVVIGFARYDSDRGGAQEDDRTSGNQNKITELKDWCEKNKKDIQIVFLNDGPGLLLGSMWDDYCTIEESWPGHVTVLTLKMLDDRFPL